MSLHGREIAVIVQQRLAMFDAESSDDNVGGFADRDSQFSQPAIVAGGARSQVTVQKRHERILAQPPFNARSMGVVAGPLKYLEQNEITDQKRFPAGDGFQFDGGRSSMTAQLRNPDGTVDKNHNRRVGRP